MRFRPPFSRRTEIVLSTEHRLFPRAESVQVEVSLTRQQHSGMAASTHLKVEPWSPGFMTLETFSRTSTAPMGRPPASGLARVIMSAWKWSKNGKIVCVRAYVRACVRPGVEVCGSGFLTAKTLASGAHTRTHAREESHTWPDAELGVLVRPEVPCAPQPALHLIKHEEGIVLGAKRPQLVQEVLVARGDACMEIRRRKSVGIGDEWGGQSGKSSLTMVRPPSLAHMCRAQPATQLHDYTDRQYSIKTRLCACPSPGLSRTTAASIGRAHKYHISAPR